VPVRIAVAVAAAVAAVTVSALVAACADEGSGARTDGAVGDAALVDGTAVVADARPDARPAPDAMNVPPSDHLGEACVDNMCATIGYRCFLPPGGGASYCTIPCTQSGEPDNCDDGFLGPGEARCIYGLPGGDNLCGIVCGEPWELPTDCPDGLVCADTTGPGGMPDTIPDTCVRPATMAADAATR
jgi:hypothetical protein